MFIARINDEPVDRAASEAGGQIAERRADCSVAGRQVTERRADCSVSGRQVAERRADCSVAGSYCTQKNFDPENPGIFTLQKGSLRVPNLLCFGGFFNTKKTGIFTQTG